jgi:hypothetical protein
VHNADTSAFTGPQSRRPNLAPWRKFCDVVMDDRLHTALLGGYFQRVFVPRNRAYFVIKALSGDAPPPPAPPVAPAYAWLR